MASFSGHLFGGAAVSAAAALAVDSLQLARPDQIPALFILGVVGSLLPDMDADGSTPVRVFYTLLGAAAAFLVSLPFMQGHSIGELALIWGAVFLLVRFGMFAVVSRLTQHRGIWHSLLAAAFAAFAITDVAYHLGGISAFESWLAGLFTAIGYLTHLCLDEIASVDLRGYRLKRSFGTAIKPFSIASPMASAVMFVGLLLLAYLAPSPASVMASSNELLEKKDLPVVSSPNRRDIDW